jgi:hypothetical protein
VNKLRTGIGRIIPTFHGDVEQAADKRPGYASSHIQAEVPNSKQQAASSKFQVPSSKFQVPSSKKQVPSSKKQVPSWHVSEGSENIGT